MKENLKRKVEGHGFLFCNSRVQTDELCGGSVHSNSIIELNAIKGIHCWSALGSQCTIHRNNIISGRSRNIFDHFIIQIYVIRNPGIREYITEFRMISDEKQNIDVLSSKWGDDALIMPSQSGMSICTSIINPGNDSFSDFFHLTIAPDDN